MKNLLYALLFGAIAFTSCKKYEEGPTVSLASKKSRVAGKWNIEEIYENGEQQQLDADDQDDIWEFEKGGEYTYTDPGNSTTTGTWEFSDNKEEIIVTTTVDWGFGTSSFQQNYKILRLKNNELWVEYIFNNNMYEIHLVPAE